MSLKNINKDEGNKKITSIGAINLELRLTLKQEEYKSYGIKLSEIRKVLDLEYLFFGNNHSLLDLVTLSSENSLINTLLYLNRSAKQKCFVELIALNEFNFSKDYLFLKRIIKEITERNYLYIVENPIISIEPKLTLVIKIIDDENDDILEIKKFDLTKGMIFRDDVNVGTCFFDALRYKFDCNFFVVDFGEILKIKKESLEEIPLFFSLMTQQFPQIKIITLFLKGFLDSHEITVNFFDTIKEVIEFSDALFFEREEMTKFYTVYNELYEIKWNKNNLGIIYDQKKKRPSISRLTVIIENLQAITILSQKGPRMDIEYYSFFQTNFLSTSVYSDESEKAKYERMVKNKYSLFQAIFIGGFLSRLIYTKTMHTCVQASNLLTEKMLDVVRFNIDYIRDLSFYQVVVPTMRKLEMINQYNFYQYQKQREKNFLLDCTNKEKSSKKEYNALFDKACVTFHQSKVAKRHLIKQGFINRKGVVLKDPLSTHRLSNGSKDKSRMGREYQTYYNLNSSPSRGMIHCESYVQRKNVSVTPSYKKKHKSISLNSYGNSKEDKNDLRTTNGNWYNISKYSDDNDKVFIPNNFVNKDKFNEILDTFQSKANYGIGKYEEDDRADNRTMGQGERNDF